MTEPVQRTAVDELERARDAYASRAWLEAYEAFSRADQAAPLEVEDLELLTTATLMLGRDDDAIGILERAHHRYLERGETLRAVRAATWIGMNLAYRGAVGPASGWLGRAQRLLDQEPGESAEHGYLLIPLVFRHEAAGEFEEAADGRRAGCGDRRALRRPRPLLDEPARPGPHAREGGPRRRRPRAPRRGDGQRDDRGDVSRSSSASSTAASSWPARRPSRSDGHGSGRWR